MRRKSLAQQTMVVILAAGKGMRMGDINTAKVCFEIDGISAITRTITTFKKKKFSKFCIVVGFQAQQVMETVSKVCPDAMFVIQNPQLGTGHAAKLAANVLESIGHTDSILVTMGDKYIEPQAIDMLIDGHIKKHNDFSLLTIPRTKRTESYGGRILVDANGRALGIVERMDIARQQIADSLKSTLSKKSTVTTAQISNLIQKHIPEAKKQKNAVPELLKLAKKKGPITKSQLEKILSKSQYNIVFDGQKYSASKIEKTAAGINPSLYLFCADAFYSGVSMLDNNNAQKEFYITDIVHHLARCADADGNKKFKIAPIPASDDNLVQGFNLPDELLAIQDYVRSKKTKTVTDIPLEPKLGSKKYSTVAAWLKKLDTNSANLRKFFSNIYGTHAEQHREKIKQIKNVLNCYGKRFGFDQKVVIVRAPGRVNLMGRHVDHRGGCNNFMAIDRETILVAGLRDDDNVIAVNTNPKVFKAQQFGISELIGRFAWDEWMNFVDSDWVKNLLRSTAGNWGNYIKAALLRLQHKYTDLKIKGLNIALTGNIPMAAGLSSSSSIVVATLQAAIELNGLELETQQFIDLCGEGEWFVGSRGGSGDHAAIYLGQWGKITNVGYLPFSVNSIVEAPEDYTVIIADSYIKAAKSAKAKSTFNIKICCYNIALELLKSRCPEIADRVEYLRDVNPQKLGCATSDIYRLLKRIPHKVTRNDLRNLLPRKHHETIEANFATHTEPPYYDVRGVLMFGIAEVARSILCVGLLDSGKIDLFGQLMKISHDGDRAAAAKDGRAYQDFNVEYDDNYLNILINNLASEDPDRVLTSQLYMQPGSYGCSTEEIDRMVDIASCVPGVAGAQIAGAGLGGCIMILAQKQSVELVKKQLNQKYYKPHSLKPAVMACMTVEGAGLIQL